MIIFSINFGWFKVALAFQKAICLGGLKASIFGNKINLSGKNNILCWILKQKFKLRTKPFHFHNLTNWASVEHKVVLIFSYQLIRHIFQILLEYFDERGYVYLFCKRWRYHNSNPIPAINSQSFTSKIFCKF